MRSMMPHMSMGLLLAYLAPGAVLLFALSFHVDSAGALIASLLSDRGSGFGAIFVALFVTLTLGVLLNAVREVLLDNLWFSERLWSKPITQPADVLQVLSGREQIQVYEQILENTYRYYQFYVNTALALLVLAVSFLIDPGHVALPWWGGPVLLLLVAVLLMPARKSLDSYSKAVNALAARPVLPRVNPNAAANAAAKAEAKAEAAGRNANQRGTGKQAGGAGKQAGGAGKEQDSDAAEATAGGTGGGMLAASTRRKADEAARAEEEIDDEDELR